MSVHYACTVGGKIVSNATQGSYRVTDNGIRDSPYKICSCSSLLVTILRNQIASNR